MNKYILLSSSKDTIGIVELYVMSYKAYLRRKAVIMFVKKTF